MAFKSLPLYGKAIVGSIGAAGAGLLGAIFIPDEIESYKTWHQKRDATARQQSRIMQIVDDIQSDENAHPLLKKHFTSQNVKSLKGSMTLNGLTLLDVVNYGVHNPTAAVPFTIHDTEALELFRPLLMPMIEEVRGGAQKQPPSDIERPGVFDDLADVDPDNKYIKNVTVECRRSLASHFFLTHSSVDDVHDAEYRIKTGLEQLGIRGAYYSYNSTADVAFMKEKGFYQDPNPEFAKQGGTIGWPKGRGVFVDESGKLAIYVNHDDHLRLTVNGSDLKSAVTLMASTLKNLQHKRLKYARDSNLGYLSCDPRHMGTGLDIVAKVKMTSLPSKTDFEKRLAELNLKARDGGNGSLLISHASQAGLGESQLVHELNSALAMLMDSESKA